MEGVVDDHETTQTNDAAVVTNFNKPIDGEEVTKERIREYHCRVVMWQWSISIPEALRYYRGENVPHEEMPPGHKSNYLPSVNDQVYANWTVV